MIKHISNMIYQRQVLRLESQNSYFVKGKNEKKSISKENLSVILDKDNTVLGYKPEPGHHTLGYDWAATFLAGMNHMCDLPMTGKDWKVWAYLVSRLDFDNWLRVKQSDICKRLKMTQSNVSRSLAKLIELDLIVKGPLAERYNTYRFNPRIIHRGAKHYRSNIVQYDELRRRWAERHH